MLFAACPCKETCKSWLAGGGNRMWARDDAWPGPILRAWLGCERLGLRCRYPREMSRPAGGVSFGMQQQRQHIVHLVGRHIPVGASVQSSSRQPSVTAGEMRKCLAVHLISSHRSASVRDWTSLDPSIDRDQRKNHLQTAGYVSQDFDDLLAAKTGIFPDKPWHVTLGNSTRNLYEQAGRPFHHPWCAFLKFSLHRHS